jgi:myo-inositol catabolism protein IolC
MDKWEELTKRIQNALLAEEPEAAVASGFELIVEFGRTFEQMGADSDRIATALEKLAEITTEPSPPKYEPPVADESVKHDL